MRSYSHITLVGHVAGKARKIKSAARFRLRFRSYAGKVSTRGEEAVIAVYAYGRALDGALSVAVNTPVLVSGRLVFRNLICIEAYELVICGDATSAPKRQRAAPTEDQNVIGHERVLPSGRVIWVKEHTRPAKRSGGNRRPMATSGIGDEVPA